jgi:outer membrane receptor protein involved in Fe transport
MSRFITHTTLYLALALPLTARAEDPTLTDEELVAEANRLAEAEGTSGSELIVIEDRAPAEAASSVHFSKDDLRRRPAQQPSDILRQTPGLVVSQHAGGGKADQYFLRGFDADHGTDVALFLDGVPINLTSHGHGQGYADAHWMIPETIGSLDVHKGPYAARFGDFYTAGAIELRTIDEIDRPILWVVGGTELAGPVAGERLSQRVVGLASPRIAGGKTLLAAELGNADGPFLAPQDFRRGAVLGKWKGDAGPGELTLSTTFYAARWNQSGQVPETEVNAGRLDRFGSLDPTEGGESSRASIAAGYRLTDRHGGHWQAAAYAVKYDLQLFSNFTLFARDTENGDQIEQIDDRLMAGVNGSYSRVLGTGPVQAIVTAGLQTRFDAAEAGLWHTTQQRRLADCWGVANPCNHVDQRIMNAAAYVEADVAIKNKLHILPGVRVDGFAWEVDDLDPETDDLMDTTAGSAQAAIVSPKLSAVLHATKRVDVFVNTGLGFHSNDARSAVATSGSGALARAIGVEAGMRIAPQRGLRASFATWYLHLASEQVWSGDNGGTEPSDPTRRYGIDVDLAWDATPWLSLDANVAVSRSTFVANAGNNGALALAPRLMGGAGVSVHKGESGVSLRARGIDERPANDDGSLMAEGYVLLDVVASHQVGRTKLTLTVNNLLDADWREAQFAESSRISPTAAEVEDVHFTPGMPLTAMLGVAMQY